MITECRDPVPAFNISGLIRERRSQVQTVFVQQEAADADCNDPEFISARLFYENSCVNTFFRNNYTSIAKEVKCDYSIKGAVKKQLQESRDSLEIVILGF